MSAGYGDTIYEIDFIESAKIILNGFYPFLIKESENLTENYKLSIIYKILKPMGIDLELFQLLNFARHQNLTSLRVVEDFVYRQTLDNLLYALSKDTSGEITKSLQNLFFKE